MKSQSNTILIRLVVIVLVMLSLLALGENATAQTTTTSIDREVRIAQLLITIRDTEIRDQNPKQFAEAIENLGELKAVEAVDDLALLITFKRINEFDEDGLPIIDHWQIPDYLYPAVSALFHIGTPSLPTLIKVIEENEVNSLASENAILVYKLIFMHNPSDAVKDIKGKIGQSEQSEQSESIHRLKNASKKIRLWYKFMKSTS